MITRTMVGLKAVRMIYEKNLQALVAAGNDMYESAEAALNTIQEQQQQIDLLRDENQRCIERNAERARAIDTLNEQVAATQQAERTLVARSQLDRSTSRILALRHAMFKLSALPGAMARQVITCRGCAYVSDMGTRPNHYDGCWVAEALKQDDLA